MVVMSEFTMIEQTSKHPAPRELPNRDFFDREFYSKMQQDFEDIRRRRKALKGRPSAEDMALIECERHFEAFYKRFL